MHAYDTRSKRIKMSSIFQELVAYMEGTWTWSSLYQLTFQDWTFQSTSGGILWYHIHERLLTAAGNYLNQWRPRSMMPYGLNGINSIDCSRLLLMDHSVYSPNQWGRCYRSLVLFILSIVFRFLTRSWLVLWTLCQRFETAVYVVEICFTEINFV